jgi:hypothetical protein
MQDFFTVGIGWVLFGGLPFDLVSFDLDLHAINSSIPLLSTEPMFSYGSLMLSGKG